MAFTRTSLVLLVALAASISAANNNTYNGCVESFNGRCLQCLERHVLANGTGCGPLQPANDTCLLYTYNQINKTQVCAGCKTGYADRLTINGTNVTQACVPGTIQGCLLEVDAVTRGLNSSVCAACPNNTYSVLNTTTRASTCQNVTNPVPNCFWGSVAAGNRAECARCNDGFALNAITRKCVSTVQTGCWIQLQKKCIACNPFEGYSINAQGTCFKTTTFDVKKGIMWAREILMKFDLGAF